MLPIAFGAEFKPENPKIVPDGWLADYDYATDASEYLRRQYNAAKQKKRTLYVYFFDDSDSHCRGIRKALDVEYVKAAFEGAQIVMLNMDRLQKLFADEYGIVAEQLSWTPSILKVSEHGKLIGPIIYPDLPMYHSKVHTQNIPSHHFTKRQEFSRLMAEYFLDNNEKYDTQ